MLPQAIDLRRVAEWTGHSIDEIQALNPELRRWTTPVRDKDYELKLPVDTAESFNAKLAEASPADLVSLNWHTVKRGETLSTIARKLRVSRVDLAQANHISTRARLRIGQELVIPRAPTTLLASNRPAAPTAVASRALSGPAAISDDDDVPQARTITYRVKRGDTLFGIARLYDTTVAKIKSVNRLRSNRIAPGDRLKIVQSR
jgi:membrane-bound lytic murein transglycosylase D